MLGKHQQKPHHHDRAAALTMVGFFSRLRLGFVMVLAAPLVHRAVNARAVDERLLRRIVMSLPCHPKRGTVIHVYHRSSESLSTLLRHCVVLIASVFACSFVFGMRTRWSSRHASSYRSVRGAIASECNLVWRDLSAIGGAPHQHSVGGCLT